MKQIENREDINTLVKAFYEKIKVDDLLGPIFNRHISKEQWPVHIEHLTDFWETNLFGKRKFKGSPTQKHINVDQNHAHTIDQKHFGKWIQLWFETINERYEGELASKAKEAARRMAHGQFMSIWHHRHSTS